MERNIESSSTDTARTQQQSAKQQVLDVVESVSAAFRARDLDKLMSYYAKDVVAYDMPPPLAFNGTDEYRKSWQMGMESMKEIGPLDIAEDKFFSSGDLAVFHSLCHMTGTLKKDAQKLDCWTRYTGVFKKIDNRWLIVHEQFSVPIDMKTERAVWTLKPSESGVTH